MDALNTVFQFDYEQFFPIVKEGLASGKIVIRDGVAYWAKGMESVGIVQHLPIKAVQSVTQQSLTQAMSAIQNTVVATQVIATGTLMVAMAIQTQILIKKIESIQKLVVNVAQGIKEQNILFYSDKVSSYLGLMQNFKLILDNRVNLSSIQPLANNTLASAMELKGHLVFFIGNLLSLIQGNKIKDVNHIELIIQFIQQIMEILPLGMHLEFVLSHRLGHAEFSQVLIENNYAAYNTLLGQYRGYLNHLKDGIDTFRIKKEDVPFLEHITQPALELIKSPMLVELLERPAKEPIAYATTRANLACHTA